ncbi:MAG TPA: SET domain-containing protein, partial [Chitinophagaceae bacterium]|nr:SET domain-containing protein [Chitinophagaceae bacterium]
RIDGKGAFANKPIPARRKIGELNGKIISVRKGRSLAKQNKRVALVELDDKFALYAGETPGVMRYINHS